MKCKATFKESSIILFNLRFNPEAKGEIISDNCIFIYLYMNVNVKSVLFAIMLFV